MVLDRKYGALLDKTINAADKLKLATLLIKMKYS